MSLDFDDEGIVDFKYATEEEYLSQGRGCALNLRSAYHKATEGKATEEINLSETDALETQACILNAIFCMNVSDENEHPVCSITIPLKSELTELNQKLRGKT